MTNHIVYAIIESEARSFTEPAASGNMEGRYIMFELYLAQDNAMNYLIFRDFQREDEDAAVINWDLSEEELKDMLLKFCDSNRIELISAVSISDLEFENFSDIRDRMTFIEEVYYTPETPIY